jgi:hypothetical protein
MKRLGIFSITLILAFMISCGESDKRREAELNYDDPEVAAAWERNQRENVKLYLSAQNVRHGALPAKPEWSLPPYISIWRTLDLDNNDTEVWVISGDLPTDYTELPTGATAQQAAKRFSDIWLKASATMLEGKVPSKFQIGKGEPSEQKKLGDLLRRRAELLRDYAADDSLWGENRPNSFAEQNGMMKLPDRGEVLNVFKEAIELNEDFKKTIGKISLDEYKKKRRELEKFNEEVLRSKIQDCVKLLLSRRDTDLAIEFLRLLISYENSADERFSFALGEIFLHNPDVVIENFDKFKKPDQEYLYKRLDWGWRNVIYGKDISKSTIQDRTEILKKLGERFKNKNSTKWEIDWVTLICAVFTSSLFATILSLLTYTIWRRRERRSLIIAFAYELVFAFHRCVIYYRHDLAGKLSYSKLFDFTDASTLSSFATAGSKTELVEAIVFLKAIYSQVARHVEEASKYAADADRLAEGQEEKQRLKSAAEHGFRTALAFFLAEYQPDLYEAIETKTEMVVNEAERIQRSRSIAGPAYLSSVFNTAKSVKNRLDEIKTMKMSSNQLREELEQLRQELDRCLIPDE